MRHEYQPKLWLTVLKYFWSAQQQLTFGLPMYFESATHKLSSSSRKFIENNLRSELSIYYVRIISNFPKSPRFPTSLVCPKSKNWPSSLIWSKSASFTIFKFPVTEGLQKGFHKTLPRDRVTSLPDNHDFVKSSVKEGLQLSESTGSWVHRALFQKWQWRHYLTITCPAMEGLGISTKWRVYVYSSKGLSRHQLVLLFLKW